MFEGASLCYVFIMFFIFLCMVNCVIAAVTWSSVLTNHRRSAFFIPHFTLRITQFRILPIAVCILNSGVAENW